MISGFFIVSCAILSATSAVVALLAARHARRRSESLVLRLRSCESRMDSLTQSQSDMGVTMAAIANKLKMMRVRAATTHTDGNSKEPDPYTNPDQWRKMMNAKLQGQKFNASR